MVEELIDMSIFKKAGVTPIVRSVISQGMGDDYSIHPIDGSDNNPKTISAGNLDELIKELNMYRESAQYKVWESADNNEKIFNQGVLDSINKVFNLIKSKVDNQIN